MKGLKNTLLGVLTGLGQVASSNSKLGGNWQICENICDLFAYSLLFVQTEQDGGSQGKPRRDRKDGIEEGGLDWKDGIEEGELDWKDGIADGGQDRKDG